MLRKLPLHITIFLGMFAGILFGKFLPQFDAYVYPLGLIFLRLLKLLVIPLIFVSVIDGIARAGTMEKLSKLGLKTVLYYMATTALAVITSLVLVNLIRPGDGVSAFGEAPAAVGEPISFMDFIPGNLFRAFTEANALQIIFIAIFMGIGLVIMGQRTAQLRSLFEELNELLLRLTSGLIAFAPIGVFGLIAHLMASFDMSVLGGVAKFAATIIIGLLIHGCVTLPIIFKLFSKRSFWRFLNNVQPALMSAFSTSSSSATLPISLECIEKEEGISKETAGFVLPIGATVNMDGTAMYEAVACLFLAQALGIDLSLGAQIVVFLTATLAAIGAASIPSAGLITLAVVLSAVHLPLEGIGFLLAFDRPLDMSRTVVNVWGDMIGCAVLEEKKKEKGTSLA